MSYWIFTDVDRKSFKHLRMHRVHLADYGEPEWEDDVDKIQNFSCSVRHRADSTQEEREHHQSGYQWSPTRLYVGKREEEWQMEYDFPHQQKLRERFPDLDNKKLQWIEHESMQAFFDFIGFDYKARKYREAPLTSNRNCEILYL